AWTPALDYLSPGKTYRIEVRVLPAAAPDQPAQEQKWTPESAGECTADGNMTAERSDSLLVTTAPVGALLAKIGGGSADVKPAADKVTVFAAGRHCVFTAAADKTGALYLGVNDTSASLARVTGQLQVTLSEAL